VCCGLDQTWTWLPLSLPSQPTVEESSSCPLSLFHCQMRQLHKSQSKKLAPVRFLSLVSTILPLLQWKI
jgi:hypothetical protein